MLAIAVGQSRIYRLKGRHRQQAGSYRRLVYMSGMSERSSEGERVRKMSQVGFQAASAAVAVVAPSRGRVEVLRSGQPGKDAGLAAPGHGWPMAAGPRSRTGARVCRATARHRTKGAKALWLLSRFSKVTRCKSETNSSITAATDMPPTQSKKITIEQHYYVQIPGFFWVCHPCKKKRASRLFDGEKVEPLRLKMHVKQAVSLVGVQITHHLRNRSS